MRLFIALAFMAVVIGCATANYKLMTDKRGQKHCVDKMTGFYVNMVNCL